MTTDTPADIVAALRYYAADTFYPHKTRQEKGALLAAAEALENVAEKELRRMVNLARQNQELKQQHAADQQRITALELALADERATSDARGHGWRSVADDPPPVNRYLVCVNVNDCYLPYVSVLQSTGYWMSGRPEPTHWMVMPPIPQQPADAQKGT